MSTVEITVQPDADQTEAWARAAGDKPLSQWLGELADAAALNAGLERTWPHVVKLKHPFDLGSERIDTITLRRGRVGDIKGMKLEKQLPTEHLVMIASRLSGQPTRVIEMLDVDDAGEVMEVVLDFFAKCLSTGRMR